jgi:hypothetical protein
MWLLLEVKYLFYGAVAITGTGLIRRFVSLIEPSGDNFLLIFGV